MAEKTPRVHVLAVVGAAFVLAALTALAYWLAFTDRAPERPRIIELSAPADCIPLGNWCRARDSKRDIALRLPAVVTYLREFEVEVRVRSAGETGPGEVTVTFEMAGMNMGMNRIRLHPAATGAEPSIWIGKAMLPVCASGRTDWQAIVSAGNGQRSYRVVFGFEAAKR
ncbi:MAG: hypothetical protein JSW10_01875 [Pseudomonadota bacterium]|nr:MAG: hypothetical protein JSW10_01875 [Pseudomonadota bacterium]